MIVDNVFQQKNEIRSRIESKRRNLSSEWVTTQSSKITSHLKTLPEYQTSKIIHCYAAWRNGVYLYKIIARKGDEQREIIEKFVIMR